MPGRRRTQPVPRCASPGSGWTSRPVSDGCSRRTWPLPDPSPGTTAQRWTAGRSRATARGRSVRRSSPGRPRRPSGSRPVGRGRSRPGRPSRPGRRPSCARRTPTSWTVDWSGTVRAPAGTCGRRVRRSRSVNCSHRRHAAHPAADRPRGRSGRGRPRRGAVTDRPCRRARGRDRRARRPRAGPGPGRVHHDAPPRAAGVRCVASPPCGCPTTRRRPNDCSATPPNGWWSRRAGRPGRRPTTSAAHCSGSARSSSSTGWTSDPDDRRCSPDGTGRCSSACRATPWRRWSARCCSAARSSPG